ncbi:hypothetical protein [Actinomadura madurae]|uniref:hypothetical protein n=1 Tax=Actinomadura madurae TaxID=1993 RepID=UPI0020D22A8E|nr:hypothetical protein [Actinomadura madurae]MCP9948177.1 hypothetical protein [Actinomadura madurae]MCP9964949.1 hypothetical protein [Actinomadura madurae]MCP9977439.1 hypothetical protein [Actinomadura madurae]MCQ0011058.1 hypothetical protein [Actinomadura madurae]MCQ0013622.1 hypothetical protein [Actinomadura madurae]
MRELRDERPGSTTSTRPEVRYQHIDALLADQDGRRQAIEWKLITIMWSDPVRVKISIR